MKRTPNLRSFESAAMRRTPTTNPQIGEQPLSFVRLASTSEKFTDSGSKPSRHMRAPGNMRISTAAALPGENPPGTRAARRLKRQRRAMASASRKGRR